MISKSLLCLSVIFGSLFACQVESASISHEDGPSHYIDLSRMDIPNQFGYFQHMFARGAFNWAPEIGSFVNMLKSRYNIKAAIETGTLYGHTTIFLASIFDQVHTIEINPSNYQASVSYLRSWPNAICHLGSSEQVLKQILPGLENQSLLFYLDAHWQDYWPLLDELEEISKTHKDNCIIVIDDFKVPGRPDIPYDISGSGLDECSYDYVKCKLEKIYSDYNYYYVLPKRIDSKAKLVVIPKDWGSL